MEKSWWAVLRRRSHLALRLAGDGQEELELGWELVFGVESVREVDSANTAVGVDLNSIWHKAGKVMLAICGCDDLI